MREQQGGRQEWRLALVDLSGPLWGACRTASPIALAELVHGPVAPRFPLIAVQAAILTGEQDEQVRTGLQEATCPAGWR